jgi:single-strand DNA-binding protein
MNSVNVVGNLTADPESRSTNSGKSICNLRMAVNDGFGDNKKTVFIDVETWEKQADICAEFLQKGSSVAVSGRLKQDTWETNDGKKASKILIVANTVDFLDKKEGAAPAQRSEKPASKPATKKTAAKDEDDSGDLPF